ncbi:MAG TPA: hypothetical protein VIB79_11940 [Candidatus Binatia bacterium]|jgi:hypothetical protein
MSAELIQIVNPLGVSEVSKATRANRNRETLQGARVGLLDNNKPNADKFLAQIGVLLQDRFGTIELIPKRKTTRTAAKCLAELAAGCDVVINAFAD